MRRAPLEIAGFVYWLYAFIDFATLWKEPWLESQQWQVWNGRRERCQIKAILLAIDSEHHSYAKCMKIDKKQATQTDKMELDTFDLWP